MWEDLNGFKGKGRKIRAIWIADVSNSGASGLLNEEFKYNDGKDICFPLSPQSVINYPSYMRCL